MFNHDLGWARFAVAVDALSKLCQICFVAVVDIQNIKMFQFHAVFHPAGITHQIGFVLYLIPIVCDGKIPIFVFDGGVFTYNIEDVIAIGVAVQNGKDRTPVIALDTPGLFTMGFQIAVTVDGGEEQIQVDAIFGFVLCIANQMCQMVVVNIIFKFSNNRRFT